MCTHLLQKPSAMPPKKTNNKATSRRKRLSEFAEDVVGTPRRLAARARAAYSPLSPTRRSKRQKKSKPRRYQSSPEEDEEQVDDASLPPPVRRSSGARRDPPPPSSSSSSSSSTTSSRGKLPPLESRSSDSQSEDLLADDRPNVLEDEVAGTQVQVPLREDGAFVLDADAPAPDLQQIGYETSSIGDNGDNDDLLLTPRRPSPRREREDESEDDSSTGSSGDNDYHHYLDTGAISDMEKARYWIRRIMKALMSKEDAHLVDEMKVITSQTIVAIEALLLVKARAQVSEMGQMPARQKFAQMLLKYRALINDIPEDFFDSPGRRHGMLVRNAYASSDYDGKQLWNKAQERLKRIRNEIIPHLPTPHRGPSGENIFDGIKALILKKFKEAYPDETKDMDDEDIIIRPKTFPLKNAKCVMLLPGLVLRSNPDVTATPSNNSSGRTRNQIRAAAQEEAVDDRRQIEAALLADSRNQDAEMKRIKMQHAKNRMAEWEDEARMKKLEAKAEVIRKNLNTLEQFKEYYTRVNGADAFARQMSSLLDELMAVDIASSSMDDDGSMDA